MFKHLKKLSKFSKVFSPLPFGSAKKRIYLDYASVTPVDPRVIRHVSHISETYFANPSSLHRDGVEAEKHMEECRKKIAIILDAHADEIIFTSGGTESDNLAIKGVIENFANAATENSTTKTLPHIVTSTIEHPAILELLRKLEKEEKCTVTYVPVTEDGTIDLKELKKSLKKETVLVTIQYVNNEIGTIQPIPEIAKIIRHHRKENQATLPYFHTDACQAPLYCPMRIPPLGVDMLTLDGGKVYGPRGIGLLYARRGLKLASQIIGGSQEREMRAGTENVPAISGFSYALELAHAEFAKGVESGRIWKLREIMVKEIEKINKAHMNARSDVQPGVEIQKNFIESSQKIIFNGSYDPKKRVPNNLNICVKGIDAEFAVLWLDARGISVSSVTSCRSKNEDSYSYVVKALQDVRENIASPIAKNGNVSVEKASHKVGPHQEEDCSKSSLRITLGRFTTEKEIKQVTQTLISYLTRML